VRFVWFRGSRFVIFLAVFFKKTALFAPRLGLPDHLFHLL